MTRARASVGPPACAKAPRGSRPCSSNAPGPQPARRAAISRLNSIACAAAVAPKKALCAVAASILTAIYHMLRDGTGYQDLGADHFDHRSTEARARRLVSQLAKLGFDVEIKPLAAVA